MKINTHNLNPNFTIVLPGPCQANCEFCFWKREREEGAFLKSLKRVLKKLPDNFTQISISGGEPTLSPVFKDTLKLINKYRKKGKIKKVVLTTNGVKITHFDLTGIDHINISRHHYDQTINEQIFKSKNIPDIEVLAYINEYINSYGIDVNYNVVFTNENIDLDIKKFIEFAKYTNASSLTFRNQYENFGISKVEDCILNSWNYSPTVEATCPVCRTAIYYVNGMKVKFHSSAYEPTESKKFDKDEVYELIMQPTGDLTRDWEAKKIILKRKGR